MSTISRRAFLKTVGVGALSVAAVSVLAGCDTVPGTTQTPVTGSLKGEPSTTYLLGNDYTISSTLVDSNATAISNSQTSWEKAYIEAYRAKFGGSTQAGWEKYDDATESEKKAVAASALNVANNDAADDEDSWFQAFEVVVHNYSESEVQIATGAPVTAASMAKVPAKAFKSNTKVFTAACDGKAVECAVNAIVLKASNDNSITCFVAATPNYDELTLTVALPGAKTVVYTVENNAHKDADDLAKLVENGTKGTSGAGLEGSAGAEHDWSTITKA